MRTGVRLGWWGGREAAKADWPGGGWIRRVAAPAAALCQVIVTDTAESWFSEFSFMPKQDFG